MSAATPAAGTVAVPAMDPASRFGARLGRIEKPARYLGGETGPPVNRDAAFRVALCFPDLYEIGMSNNAMRILYAGLNALVGVACERVFAPADDYAQLLVDEGVELYGLETFAPVVRFDILAFTIGYELAATNVLRVMDLSGVSLTTAERGDGQPIVIAGGPAVTNPLPYSGILDAVWIGEAEEAFFDLVRELAAMKASGAGRTELLGRIRTERAVWMPGKRARRHVYAGFADRAYGHSFPVPVVKPVQDHGVVEIMRGCPNACRFCHAGYFYRPRRVRSVERIVQDVEGQVRDAGHREITLSSLSSGDYPGILPLLRGLNTAYGPSGVSFQLPSLKIETLSLEVIEEVSGTRKAGLTFAVETPLDCWQLTINKRVARDKVKGILSEAARAGYRLAKFYFMIGLPLPAVDGMPEESAIVEFLNDMAAASPIRLNVTVSTFIPKPHTPFQWAAQLDPREAARRIYAIKDAFRNDARVKVTYHAPFLSWLEGLVSRGDARVGDLLLEAYRRGARFDAWDDQVRKEAWTDAMEALGVDLDGHLHARSLDEPLPWDTVSLGVSTAYLKAELARSVQAVSTSACIENCTSPCGSCTDVVRVETVRSDAEIAVRVSAALAGVRPFRTVTPPAGTVEHTGRIRVLFRYRKSGAAAFCAHHDVWSLVAAAFERAGYRPAYSEGFNPSPRLEISEPLPLGTSSLDEYGLIVFDERPVDMEFLLTAVNAFLPVGMPILECVVVPPSCKKPPSLSSVYWGSTFLIDAASSGIDVASFAERGRAALVAIDALADGTLSLREDGSLELLLPFTGKRETGLSSLFQSWSGQALRETEARLTRIRQYARGPRGKTGYMEAYTSTESLSLP